MTVMSKFTPEVLLEAPRRSAAVPNSKGTLALYTVSTYSFASHSRSSELRVLDIQTGRSTILSDSPSYSDPTWISDTHFLLLKSRDRGTLLVVVDATEPAFDPRAIRSFDGSLSNLKATKISDDTVAIACSAPTDPSGQMYNACLATKPLSSGRAYTKLYVRHWDSYVSETKSSIWYGALKISGGTFMLQSPGLVNALASTKLECPIPPFGGSSDFDISSSGLVFVSSDPEWNSAVWTKSDLYYVPLETFTEESPPPPQIVKTGALRGYSGNPVFSHDGKKLAFKRMKNHQYESDKPRLLLIPDIKDLSNVQEFYKTEDGEGAWDTRPDSIIWSNDDTELYVIAEDKGRSLLYKLPASPLEAKNLPEAITKDGSIGEVFNLAADDDRLFANGSSLVDSSTYSIIDPSSSSATVISSLTKNGKSFGLSSTQVSSIWFKGAGNYQVHALVMVPSDFDPSKTYPLALLIHGGPQGAWNEAWSTRWNPAVFAEQGYVAVMPNPTGSTGYGQKFTDDIALDWGGRPYNDIVNCFEYIEDNLRFVDTKNAVALGASYGGYMINWIQGHPLGRKFKALVTHDGIFTTMNNWSTEELFFPIHDMGGTLWENRASYEKWDPAAHTNYWATPHLIIHNELDYRLPITEGLSAFNVLQVKGVPSRMLIFPDENHWVVKPENSLRWHQEVLGWINKYTGIDETGAAADVENLAIN